MAYKKVEKKTQYNSKLHISLIEFKRETDRKPTQIPYITILDNFAYPKTAKSGKKYLRIPVVGQYALDRLTSVYGDENQDETIWLTAFLPNDKCRCPESEKCKLSCCGTLRFDPENGYTVNIDQYAAAEVE